MYDTLRKIRESKAEDDRGFTLIELLVVVVIIGILVAIAIPIYLHYQKNAQDKSAESDARNAAVAIEACYTDTNSWPDNITTAIESNTPLCKDSEGNVLQTIVVSSGNELTYSQADGDFTVDVASKSGQTWEYSSATGQITKTD